MVKVRQRKRVIVESFRNGGQLRFENTKNVTLLFGETSFTDAKMVEVKLNGGDVRHFTVDKIFINTGGRAEKPSVEGLDSAPYLDSTSILELDIVPEHRLVLGGGYIGLEFGQMFRRFGSEVTIV
jgi:pyruvate/2-oxoglutarate dehydrogenase complex dihydrolipoamide dehydrogenase (E3) component